LSEAISAFSTQPPLVHFALLNAPYEMRGIGDDKPDPLEINAPHAQRRIAHCRPDSRDRYGLVLVPGPIPMRWTQIIRGRRRGMSLLTVSICG